MSNKRVLVLHQSDELKVIEFQTNLQKKFEAEGKKVLKTYPLFAFFEEEVTDEDLKLIESVTIKAPEQEGNYLYLPVCVFDGEREIIGKIRFLFLCDKTEFIPDCFPFVEIKSRIFRFAFFHQEENSYWLTDSRWKKLSKTEN